jgi:Flp pilus assembly protein TadD
VALGAVAAKQKDDSAAREAAQRAVSLDPLDGSARLALGDLLARGGDSEQAKALDEYRAFMQIGGDAGDEQRVERAMRSLEKRLAQR